MDTATMIKNHRNQVEALLKEHEQKMENLLENFNQQIAKLPVQNLLLIKAQLSTGPVYKLAGTSSPVSERANSFRYHSVPGRCVYRLACCDHAETKRLTESLWMQNELMSIADGNWFRLDLEKAVTLSPNSFNWVEM